ncbi:MAG: hypothetical protein J6Q55_03930, partial [Clostridia bacterium]|nr:hypothetical protein [Clostridia bacterium]
QTTYTYDSTAAESSAKTPADNFASTPVEPLEEATEDLAILIGERIAKNNEKIVPWSKVVFISFDKTLLAKAEQIGETGIYYEINLSAPYKISVIKALLNEYDIDLEDFKYVAKSYK